MAGEADQTLRIVDEPVVDEKKSDFEMESNVSVAILFLQRSCHEDCEEDHP
jgi:hypothetical protein